MTVTNGYITLSEMRERLSQDHTYTAATLAFVASSKKLTDTARGLKRFDTGRYIRVQGSAKNDGYYTVATGGAAGEIVVSEALQDEALGAAVTISDVTDVASDAQIEDAINSASRAIDRACGRRFYKNTEAEIRYYTPEAEGQCTPDDDIVSISALATDDTENRTYAQAWTATDYELEPANATLDGKPYSRIVTTPHGARTFEAGSVRSVKVTGVFGWPSVPAEVKAACALLAGRVYRRKEVPFGAFGSVDQGSHQFIPEADPDVMALLRPYVREAPRAVIHWDMLDR